MSDFQEDTTPDGESITTQPRKSRRTLWIVVGAIVLVAVLAGAAFIAGRLISPPASTQNEDGGPKLSLSGPGGKNSVSIHETAAKELPTTSPTVRGLVVDRQDQILSVGTGNVTVSAMSKGPGQQPTIQANYNGPVIQVVITHDTKIYKDVTPMEIPKSGGTVNVQQVVAPGSLDDIGKNVDVRVWGNRQGERVVADVLVYRGL
jgi:hypothetical protein